MATVGGQVRTGLARCRHLWALCRRHLRGPRAALPTLTVSALALLAGLDAALAAKLVAARGEAGAGFGRIVLTFDRPVPVKATVSGGVLVLGYGDRVAAGPERLAEELPAYVAAARRDPDGTGLRLALQRPTRASVQAAGERVFVDLLPEGWTGAVPPLPPEVVADLARRARAAEVALAARAPAPPRKVLPVELARLPTLTRLSVRLPDEAVATVTGEGPATRVRIAGAWTLDAAETRGRPRPGIAALAVEADEASASLLVTPAEGFAVTSVREDGTLALDVVRRAPAKPDARAGAEPGSSPRPDAGPASAVSPPAVSPPVQAAAGAQDPPRTPEPAQGASAAPVAASPARARDGVDAAAGGDRPVEARPSRQAGAGLAFPFRTLPPAALFERGGVAILAFETAEPVAAPAPAAGLRALGAPARTGPLTILRFAVPPGRILDLAAVSAGSGVAWELSAGEAPSPSDTLEPQRRPDAAGRMAVSVPLPRPGSAAWLDLDGERVVVVASAARRPAGNPRRRRFVDFEILPSRHGLAVRADADDLAVRPDLDGVTIGRKGGLSASSIARAPDTPLAEAGPLAVVREAWERARLGPVRDTLRGLAVEAGAAPPGERGPGRMALARALLANGLDAEALAAIDAASADDPLLAARRDTAILRGLALARLGRNAEAGLALAGEKLAADPEAALWRAVAAGGAGAWTAAEVGFLKALPLAEGYPDDLVGPIRALAAEAAIETGAVETAAARAAAGGAGTLAPWPRDRLALVRARVSEATGQDAAAIEAYNRLADSAVAPVAAEAALRGTLLAHRAGSLSPEAAAERLERVALSWHGGPVEDGTVAGLARLHLAAGRWREAFAAVRRANARAPDAPATRALTAEAQADFEALYLGEAGARLSGVEAVALYFDFRELAPIGRRGDAVVRRLADRLVALDLLEPAVALLQHQIDHRLSGPARAAVAARLAAVQLMDGKPLPALAALEATDLPELPGDLRRARALIRARALSDLTRTDLALESIEGEAGPDVERLRADILWSARRWREAGEAHEALLGSAWDGGRPLDEAARADAVRAAIAYGLAGEAIGLERLKAKASGAMAQGPDARTFALLTGPDPTRNPGFRAIAAKATKAETLSVFLAEYRRRYPEAAVPDRAGAEPPAGGAASAQAPQGGAPPG